MDSLGKDGRITHAVIVLGYINSSLALPVRILSVASHSSCGSVTVLSDGSFETLPKEEPIEMLPNSVRQSAALLSDID